MCVFVSSGAGGAPQAMQKSAFGLPDDAFLHIVQDFEKYFLKSLNSEL